jgi:hypothetical protein
MQHTEPGDNDKKERQADDQDLDELHRTCPEGFLYAEMLRIERL